VGVHGCKKAEDYYNRGVARLEKRENDSTISDFTKAIEMRPGFAMAYSYRGRAYLRKSEYDHAISDLNKAIEIDPQLAVAYGERAMIYFYFKKEYDKTWENIRKQESLGLEINPVERMGSHLFLQLIILTSTKAA
jgi:tetratricopeptide (TPR) repeat protein